jgi:hypothetical protein
MGDPSGWLIRATPKDLEDITIAGGGWGASLPFEDVTVSGDAGTVLYFKWDGGAAMEKHLQTLQESGLELWETAEEDIARRRALHRAQCRKDDVRARQGAAAVNRRRCPDRHAGGRALKDKRRNLTRRVRTGRRGR